VFGVDVTDDVSSCTMTYNDGRAPNTCEFVLTSPFDRYTITETDIGALYSNVDISAIELPAFQATVPVGPFSPEEISAQQGNAIKNKVDAIILDEVNALIRDRVGRLIQDETKKRVLQIKVSERVENISSPDLNQLGMTLSSVSAASLASLRGDALTYQMKVGDCIFHSNDPVRIAWRDPFSPNKWYWMFSGFVAGWTDRLDENNQSTVTIRCEDVSRILRYSRVSTNPGIFDIAALEQSGDAVLRTFFSDGFSNLSLSEFLFTLIFGSEAVGTTAALGSGGSTLNAVGTSQKKPFIMRRVSAGGTTQSEVRPDGAGIFNFNKSMTLLLGQEEVDDRDLGSLKLLQRKLAINDLGVYQATIDHLITEDDLLEMALEDELDTAKSFKDGLTRDAYGKILNEEIITTIGENPHIYPVDYGRLIILEPASLGPSKKRTLLTKDLIGVNTQTTWKTRLGMIYDVVQRIDFSFYASPRGDLICEMPLYDHRPEDFGTEFTTKKISSQDTTNVVPIFNTTSSVLGLESVTFANLNKSLQPGQANQQHGPFAEDFRVLKQDTINWDRTFVDERVRTLMVSGWSVLDGYVEAGGTNDVIGALPGAAYARQLVPQFGIRQEQTDVRGFIDSPEAARVYAEVKLSQVNADAISAKVEIVPRPGLVWPNRPIVFGERSYIATTRQITHSLTWGAEGSMGMSLDVNYVRGWDGSVETVNGEKLPLYSRMGGFAASALNYAIINKKTNPPEGSKSQKP
jgi:hypothetical protein